MGASGGPEGVVERGCLGAKPNQLRMPRLVLLHPLLGPVEPGPGLGYLPAPFAGHGQEEPIVAVAAGAELDRSLEGGGAAAQSPARQ